MSDYQKAYNDGYVSAAESSIYGLLEYVKDELDMFQIESLRAQVNLKFDRILADKKKDEVDLCLPLL
jgi:hypothetical protein